MRYHVENRDGYAHLCRDGKKITKISGWYATSQDQARLVADELNAAYEAGLAERPVKCDVTFNGHLVESEPPKPVTIDFKYPGYFDGCRDPKGEHDDERSEAYFSYHGSRYFVKRCPCSHCDRRRARKAHLRKLAEDKAEAKFDRKYFPDKPFLKPRSLFWNCINGMALGVVIAWYAFILPSQDELNRENAELRARVEKLAKYEDGIITEYVTDVIHPNTFGGGITRTCGDTSYKVTCEYPKQVYGPKLARSDK